MQDVISDDSSAWHFSVHSLLLLRSELQLHTSYIQMFCMSVSLSPEANQMCTLVSA